MRCLFAFPLLMIVSSARATTATPGPPVYEFPTNNGSGQPGSLIVDGGSSSVTISNATSSVTLGSPVTVGPGLYFLAADCNSTPTLRAGAATGTWIGLSSPGDTSAFVKASQSYGALPTSFPTVTYASTAAPLVFFSP